MRWLKGKTDVVAPISAPMLQMVAIPVQERLDTGAEVFDNGAGSILDGEDSSNLEDDICPKI